MLNVVFLDTIGWDYDVAAPLERPLGGSQSALCYLAAELAQRGHRITVVNNIAQPRDVFGVACRNYAYLTPNFLQQRFDAFVVLNGPAELYLKIRPHLVPGTPLVLWTQHAVDQPAMQSLAQAEVRAGWSVIVAVSDWHRRTLIEHFGLDAARVAVLRNAVGQPFEQLFSDRAALVQAKSGPPTLAYTSTPFRGLDVLLTLFPEARREFPDLQLTVYSSMKVYQQAEAADSYTALYDWCRKTPGIVYAGSLPQRLLAGQLRNVSGLAYPNTFAETSCIAVMEAMAAGLTVVTTDLGALPETTMGMVKLVPPHADANIFRRDYLEQLLAVLRRRAADPEVFAGQLFEQVQAVNARGTWRVRAAEWEEAIHSWTAAQTARTDMTLEQAQALARSHWQAGRLDKAEAVSRLILQHFPQDAEAHRLLGLVAYRAGHAEAAIDLLRRAIALNPQEPEYTDNLRFILNALGRTAEAAGLPPSRPTVATPSISQLLQSGKEALAQQRFADAVTAFQQALSLDPALGDAEHHLGFALQALGRRDDALVAYQRAAILRPNSAIDHFNLGCLLRQTGRLEEARAALEEALTLQPDYPEAANNLGNTLSSLGKVEEAVTAYERALKQRPDFTEAHNNLATAFQTLGRLDEAEIHYRQVLAMHPNQAATYSNLGNLLQQTGRFEEAVELFRKALALAPDLVVAHSNLLLAEHYRPGVTLAGLAAAHAEWDKRHAASLRSTWQPFANSRDPERPLRLGLVSSDFGQHPVGFFLVRFLDALALLPCDTIAYSDRLVADNLTRRIQDAVTDWRAVHHLTDAELAEQIRADGIDILIDLGGHTARHRLLTFARKPAPVQLTWIGYVGTTGLSAMDYLIADRFHVPEGAEVHYREKVLRLPDGYVCYDPPSAAPAVNRLPALARGYVTFASISNPAKIGPPVVDLWSRILHQVPRSRLLLQYRGFGDPAVQRKVVEQLGSHGIAPERLELCGKIPHVELLARYHEVDIALDPFPYSGGLTTCEALWMGVPVVTCPGETFAGRHAFSHLSNIGLTETIASDHADYVARAVALAQDLPRLTALRAGLRQRMAQAPLCDGARFARNFLAALRTVWRDWCRDNPAPAGSSIVHEPSPSAQAEAEYNLAVTLQAEGHWDEAETRARRAADLDPECGDAWHALGLSLHMQNRLEEAATAYRQALQRQAPRFDTANNLGLILSNRGRPDEAEAAYRQALDLRPEYPEALYNLANLLRDCGRWIEAETAYRQALTLRPTMALGHNNLGRLLKDLGRLDEAEACYRQALALNPNLPEAHNNLGNIHQIHQRLAEAEACYRRALVLRPNLAEAENNLCSALQDQGRLAEAIESAQRTLALRPKFAEAQMNLGNALQSQGRPEEALVAFQRAVELQPALMNAFINILKCSQHAPGITLARLADLHAEFDRRYAAPLRSQWRPCANTPDPERPLRLGLVSPDLGYHPVGFFLVKTLESLDRRRYETVVYSSRALRDDLTERIARAVALRRDVLGRTDEELTEQIRADGIDLLFDLSGCTGGQRLLVFARKPAPVQLTWIGYVGTTGLSAMDYLIADRFHVPEGADIHFREKVLRLPDGYVCYEPPPDAPAVGPLPALANGFVTFGSFNNPMKLTPPVIELWSQVMSRIPGSRLVLQFLGLDDPGTRKRLTDMFAVHGIQPGRLTFHGWTARAELLARYNQIDIGLDPFPYAGGLTTCEALWMGVPVVTCPGETFASRHSFSHMSNAGLTEPIAADHADYVNRTVALVKDLPALAALRAGLRERMARSPLCDGPRFARNLETALREVWKRWCAGRQ